MLLPLLQTALVLDRPGLWTYCIRPSGRSVPLTNDHFSAGVQLLLQLVPARKQSRNQPYKSIFVSSAGMAVCCVWKTFMENVRSCTLRDTAKPANPGPAAACVYAPTIYRHYG